MTTPAARRTYLDVLRGVAVLIMIEAHVIDSWTRETDRHSRAFGESLILGGFGAPLFLFLAGVGVAMSAGSKSRRLAGDDRAAAAIVARRGLQIFGLAFIFRFQSFVLSNAPAWTLLKVDIPTATPASSRKSGAPKPPSTSDCAKACECRSSARVHESMTCASIITRTATPRSRSRDVRRAAGALMR